MIAFAKISCRYGDLADAKISSKYGDAIRDTIGDASGSAGRWSLVLSIEFLRRVRIDFVEYQNSNRSTGVADTEILLIRRYQANTETLSETLSEKLSEKLGDADTVTGLLSIVLGAGRRTVSMSIDWRRAGTVAVQDRAEFRNEVTVVLGVS